MDYRGHDFVGPPAASPFGHGLSYTSFACSDVTAQVSGHGQQTSVAVGVTITNTGKRDGTEVVQVNVAGPPAPARRPRRELKAFTKVGLTPGGSTRVELRLDARDLSCWHPGHHDWVLGSGAGTIQVGAYSTDLRAAVDLDITGDRRPEPLTAWSTLREALAHPAAGPVVLDAITADPAAGLHPHVLEMCLDLPLRVISGFNGFDGFAIEPDELPTFLDTANDVPTT